MWLLLLHDQHFILQSRAARKVVSLFICILRKTSFPTCISFFVKRLLRNDI